MPSNTKTSLSVLDMIEISEERKAFQPENILHCFMILAMFVIPIKVDGVDLTARVHLIILSLHKA